MVKVVYFTYRGLFADNPRAVYEGLLDREDLSHTWLCTAKTQPSFPQGVETVLYGTPEARALDKLTVTEARQLLAAGEFPDGSMGPKVEACCTFAAAGGARAVIGALAEAVEVVIGDAGTAIQPD